MTRNHPHAPEYSRRAVLGAFAGAGLLWATPAFAQDFYEGKTVTIIVATNPGGGYALAAELLAHHIGNHIPGHPNVIVQFMPGGHKALAYLTSVASKDGTVFGVVSQGAPVDQLVNQEVPYDVAALSYIGRLHSTNAVAIIWSEAPANTLEGIKQTEVIFGTSARTDDGYIFPTLLRDRLGYQIKVVQGYDGAAVMDLAIERGEIHGRINSWAGIKVTAGSSRWLQEGRIVPLFEVGLQSSPDLAGVPLIEDLFEDPSDRALVRFLSSSATVGRQFVAPPGVAEDQLRILQDAFNATVVDPAFLEEAAQRNLAIEPLTATELRAVVDDVLATPPEIVAAAREYAAPRN